MLIHDILTCLDIVCSADFFQVMAEVSRTCRIGIHLGLANIVWSLDDRGLTDEIKRSSYQRGTVKTFHSCTKHAGGGGGGGWGGGGDQVLYTTVHTNQLLPGWLG